MNNQVARPTVHRAQVSTRMSHLAVHHLAGRRAQGAARRTQLVARSSGTRYKSQARRSQDAARSSQLACPNRNSIQVSSCRVNINVDFALCGLIVIFSI